MKTLLIGATITGCLFAGIATAAGAEDEIAARSAASREAVQSFAKSLKGRLVAAMTEGGPAHAIGECNVAAPEISLAESEARGWSVARTSLKVRNPGSEPDAWELAVLQEFEARKAAGGDVKALEHAEIVTEDDGTRTFRYMKAIPTQKVCTKCHGTDIAPDVVARLEELYPDDTARGFAVGDIRGAFTISQPVE